MDPTDTPNAHECARMLLTTIPSLMRSLKACMRAPATADDEPLTLGQFRMLSMLSYAPCTLGELANQHNVTPSTMSRTIDLLVRKQWVERRDDPNDRRQVILTLTTAGAATHSAMRQHTEDALAGLLEQLSDAERNQIYGGLAALRTLLEGAQ